MKGGPEKVGGSFYCNNTKITSLEGAPREVGENFNCSNTKIFSLEGAPREVGGFFWCSSCELLKSLKGAPAKVKDISYSSFPNRLKVEAEKYIEWLKTNPTENYPG